MKRPAPGVDTGPTRPRPARPWPIRIGLTALVLIAALGPRVQALTGPSAAPSTLLLHAGIPEALEFAAETARQRGWTILHTRQDSVTFEQPIDADGTATSALLRIEASFTKSPAGVTVTLRAQEIQTSDGGAAETRDVTQPYRENLLNALDSLASKWGLRSASAGTAPPQPGRAHARAGTGPTAGGGRAQPSGPGRAIPGGDARPHPANVQTRLPGPADMTDRRAGAWAYYAERYAEGHGCTLGDLGAVLEGTRDGAELHRVHCADGRQMLVRCQAEGLRCGALTPTPFRASSLSRPGSIRIAGPTTAWICSGVRGPPIRQLK